MDAKDKILEKLASMDADTLDKLRDEKQLELKNAMHKYHKAKDDEMVLRHNKRKEFIEQGNSLGKAEQMLRADDELFKSKRLVMGLSDEKNQLKLTVEIVSNYYWKART